MPISSGSLGGGGGSSSAAASVYWAEHRIPDTSAIYSDFDLLTPVDWADIAAGATIVSRADLQVYYKTGSGVEKAQGNDIVLINGDTSALDFGRVCWVDRGAVGGAIHPILMSVMPGMATGVLDEGPVLVCVTTPMDTGVATNDGNIPQFEPVRVTLGSPRCRVQINGTGLAGETIFLKTDGTFTTTRPVGQTYYEIGRIIVGPFADGTADMWFYPRFHLGAASVSGSVIDNAITDSRAVSVIGRYIVPKENLLAIPPVDLLNDFDGRSNQYADWSGAYDTTDPLNPFPTGFTFSAPDDGDTVIITTGSRTGEVWRYKASTTSWGKVTQTTGLPTYTWDKTKSYLAGDLVIYNQLLWQANANIAANTDFATGTSGQTWKQIGTNGAALHSLNSGAAGSDLVLNTTPAQIASITITQAGVYDFDSDVTVLLGLNQTAACYITRNGAAISTTTFEEYAFNGSGITLSQTRTMRPVETNVTCAVGDIIRLVAVASFGSAKIARTGGLYPRLRARLVSGILPVVGSTRSHLQASRTTAQTGMVANSTVLFNQVDAGDIAYNASTGQFTLKAGRTYRLTGCANIDGSGGRGYLNTRFYNNTAGVPVGTVGAAQSADIANAWGISPVATAVVTPSADTAYSLRVAGLSGATAVNSEGTWLFVEELGVSPQVAEPFYHLRVAATASHAMSGGFVKEACRYATIVLPGDQSGGASAWWNAVTYTFTPQVAGWWQVRARYENYRGSTSAEAGIFLEKNGTSVAEVLGMGDYVQEVSDLIYLNGSTDGVRVTIWGGAANTRTQTANRSNLTATLIRKA